MSVRAFGDGGDRFLADRVADGRHLGVGAGAAADDGAVGGVVVFGVGEVAVDGAPDPLGDREVGVSAGARDELGDGAL